MIEPISGNFSNTPTIHIENKFNIGDRVKVHFLFCEEGDPFDLEGDVVDIDNLSYDVYFEGRGRYSYPENRLRLVSR